MLDEFEGWGPSDLLVLRLALEALDRDEECRRRIATDGLTLTGKRGGMRPHPLLRAERAAAAFALAAFKQLGLGARS